jgi:hypothetical protein
MRKNMGEQHKVAEANKGAAFYLSVLVKVIAAIAAVGGIGFHFLGLVVHIAYLRDWGIDAGLFPKPTDWLMTNGAVAYVDRTTTMLAAAHTITGRLAMGALLLFLAAMLAHHFSHHPVIKSAPTKVGSWPRSFGFAVVSTLITFGLVPIAMLFFTTVIAPPWLMGETYGAAAAQRERAIFNRGCPTGPVGYRCIDVRKGNQLLVRGFLIESSTTHIAIYDPEARRTRTIPREGTELITDPLPSEGSASSSGK